MRRVLEVAEQGHLEACAEGSSPDLRAGGEIPLAREHSIDGYIATLLRRSPGRRILALARGRLLHIPWSARR